jgi:putative DNA primase/helicase
MRRKKRDEKVESLPLDDDAQPFADLRRQCTRWATDSVDKLRRCLPVVPDWLNDRAADNWRPLCAIAEVAGGDWPDRLRRAIQTLVSGIPEDEEAGVLLLHDLQQMFHVRKTDRLFSEDLAKALHEMEERPWPEYGKQRKPITPPQIARLLKPFGIRPKQVRIGTETSKGYLYEDCQDTFARYVVSSTPTCQTETPKHISNTKGSHEI